MKKTTTLFAAILLLAVGATAQKLSYQAVVRNNANELVTETTVQVAVTVLNANNAVQYSETHANVQTNRNGLLSLMIGDGVPTGSATLAGVEWPGASLRTVITLPDNTTITNVTPVNSVPYALYAENVSPEALLAAVNAMTAEQKAAFKETLAFTCGTNKMVDADGNEYETVQIGTQCWTKTNLRSTKAADGTAIAVGSDTSTTVAYRYYPNNNSSNVSAYGYLYNWEAAKLVCPAGWHLPSDAEWTTLITYVSGQSEYTCGGNTSYNAKALASTEGWGTSSGTCAVGNNPSTNNATGFSAVPAGYYGGNGSLPYLNFSCGADFWSATQSNSSNAYSRNVFYYYSQVRIFNYSKSRGYSVRCLHD